MKKHVFLSYCREDLASVAPFRATLEASKVPIWLDSQAMQAGDNLPAAIEDGLREAGGAVIFLSETYLRKGWTLAEMRYLTTRMIRDSKLRLILVHLDGCEVPPLLEPVLRSTVADAATVAKVLAEALDLPATAGSSIPTKTIERKEFFERITDADVIAISGLLLAKCDNAPFRDNPQKLPFKVNAYGAVLLELLTRVPEISVNELRAAVKILTIHQRFCSKLDEQIKQGGLGLFELSFEMELEKKTLAYQEKLIEIRAQLGHLVYAIVHDPSH